ncbi:anti-sigma F factor [Natranaerobius trueperi]|uniref:Anti-sigma F factor n=1 Tax=Natranaerobius trueperi TaxID=759412 RepID=A0A226BY93_9FIRM|nr:anti-sigma F factor [Natranaerobius trueperi]OWZ83983.1 anti-sigma F factor [Natranaerobius trueperi]
MTQTENYMELWVSSNSQNESFCRVVVAAFVSRIDPTIEEINDIKTAVSEAVTNSIIHGYPNDNGNIKLTAEIKKDELFLRVQDFGVGIKNLDKAKEPLYTTRPELERSGMGFTIMENFMDEVEVKSAPNEGTLITMSKKFSDSKE